MIPLASYQASWQERFLEEKKQLKELEVFHIGSTAIVDCLAKPIIDILGVVTDVTTLKEIPGFEALGEYGIRGRRFYRKEGVHLHIFEQTDPEVTRHLRFVAYMNGHPKQVRAYGELKQLLSGMSREEYTLGKTAFIKKIDILAAMETPPTAYPLIGPPKQVWTKEEIVRALHTNMFLCLTYFSKYLEVFTLVYQPDVTVLTAPFFEDAYNIAFDVKFSDRDAWQRVKEVNALFKANPFCWWVSEEDTPKSLPEQLIKAGLSLKEDIVGMSLSIGEVIRPSDDIRRVTKETLGDFCRIVEVFERNAEVYTKLPEVIYGEGAPCEMYLLYEDGKAVTTGLLLYHAGVAGIYYIATMPGKRGQGLATAMMNFLLQRAKEKGYVMAILAASRGNMSMYQRLGFEECCQFGEYGLRE